MSDLISRSALIKKLESMSSDNDVRNNSHQFTYKELAYIICNQPTAYDISKVVEELKECSDKYKSSSCEYEQGKAFSYKNAIDIVKRGGVE